MPLKQVKADEVVEGRQQHQAKHECQAEPESYLLCTLAQRPPQDRLKSIVQKVAAVEHWNRQKISESNGHGDIRGKIEERDEPYCCKVTSSFRNSQRAHQDVRTRVSNDQAAEVSNRSRQNEPGLFDSVDKGRWERERLKLWRQSQAERGGLLAGFVRGLSRSGRCENFQGLAVAFHSDIELTAIAARHDVQQVGEPIDGLTIDGANYVAHTDARGFGCGILGDRSDDRRLDGLLVFGHLTRAEHHRD